jgi:hypothetical protein
MAGTSPAMTAQGPIPCLLPAHFSYSERGDERWIFTARQDMRDQKRKRGAIEPREAKRRADSHPDGTPPLDPGARRLILDAARGTGPDGGPDAAHSQDWLYGDDGLPT